MKVILWRVKLTGETMWQKSLTKRIEIEIVIVVF